MTDPRRYDALELTPLAWRGRVVKISAGLEQSDEADSRRMAGDLMAAWRWIDTLLRASDDVKRQRAAVPGAKA